MKLAFITLYWSNYQPLADLVLPNLREYCDRHGYDLCVHNGSYGDTGPIGFHRTRYVRDVLPRYDAAIVTDLDIVVTNMAVTVESYLNAYPDHDYLITKDVNGLNNGSTIIRNTPWSLHLLDVLNSGASRMSNEQDILKGNEDKLVSEKLKVVPHPAFNQYLHTADVYPEWMGTPFPNDWEPGHFILHLPGLSLAHRLSILTDGRITITR